MSEQANIDKNVITCPNCQARYDVDPATLGAHGRQVKCAKCHQSWKARIEASAKSQVKPLDNQAPQSDKNLMPDEDEAALDAEFEAMASETESAADTTKAVKRISENQKQNEAGQDSQDSQGPQDPSAKARTRAEEEEDLVRRRNLLARTMPKARLSKLLRVLGVALLMIVSFSGLFLRENIVRTFPDLAGLYQGIGLGVNVVGLEFSDTKTLRVLREGDEVMEISANIRSVSAHQVSVPRIIVTLLDENGDSVFEWSVTSRAAIMLPGEWIEFETQLISPPKEATRVRLAFERSN